MHDVSPDTIHLDIKGYRQPEVIAHSDVMQARGAVDHMTDSRRHYGAVQYIANSSANAEASI